MNIYRQRMENVVRALQEMPSYAHFTMADFGDDAGRWRGMPGSGTLWSGWADCGTPWCCLGHYAVRTDLQGAFRLGVYGDLLRQDDTEEFGLGVNSAEILCHFDLTKDEAWDLFGNKGCGDAQTPADAIAYIKNFIAKKWPAPEMAKLKAELEVA